MKLYIAGPMTGLPDYNYGAFAEAEEQLKAAGYEVVSPVKEGDREIRDSQPYDFFLNRGLSDITHCQGIALLDGWCRSSGAKVEMKLAIDLNMPVARIEHWISGVDRWLK